MRKLQKSIKLRNEIDLVSEIHKIRMHHFEISSFQSVFESMVTALSQYVERILNTIEQNHKTLEG